MHLRWFLIFITLLFQNPPAGDSPDFAKKYQEAIAFFQAEEPTELTDSLARSLFLEIVSGSASNKIENWVLLDSYEKLGSLALIGGDLSTAVIHYRKGLELKNNQNILDSLFFGSNLFIGETYYLLSKADSSIYFLEEAEKLIPLKKSNEEASRLYNSLGVIYFESGNYTQAINYFNKSKNLIIPRESYDLLEPYYKYALFSFMNNIGTSLLQLGKTDSALHIYNNLLGFEINENQVYSQLSKIYLKKENPDSSLYFLDKIISPEYVNNHSYQNQLAEILLSKGKLDEAKTGLLEFLEKNGGMNQKVADFKLGKTFQILGKIAFQQKDFQNAVHYFHQSIIQTDGLFDNQDIFENPKEYSVGFATFSLVESLVGKAQSFIKLHEKEKKRAYWDAGLDTYQTAFDIASFVGNFYDNDEARIFLGDFVLEAYQEAVNTLLIHTDSEDEKTRIYKAIAWVEGSKSTSLNIGMREKKLKKISGIPIALLQKESDLQFSISKIQQRILNENKEEELMALQSELTDSRLELSRLHKEFNDFPEFVAQKTKNQSIDLNYIQESILDKNTLLLSFFELKDRVLLFTLDQDEILVTEIGDKETLEGKILEFKKGIIGYEAGEKYEFGGAGNVLFEKILGPVSDKLDEYDHLMVIPHGILADLPFDSFESSPSKFLIFDHSVSYQLSLKLLESFESRDFEDEVKTGFAPFYDNSWKDENINLTQLPYSKDEINSLHGKSFISSEGTKRNFLETASGSEVIHLSTHALPDPNDPQQAFITFFPGDIESRLFTHEIYNLDLSESALIFLSACETNFGSLSKSEGILSISRAFAFAGCPNIISALWKAEDKSTAYITDRFYSHVENGLSYAEALREAKKDLLEDEKMAQFHHPVFWAHLVLVGSIPAKTYFDYLPVYLWIFAFILLGFGYLLVKNRFSNMSHSG
ncbi:CHAT domain-containing protein [Aquiflexum gelatinilyticum]|uniref:CHAT domain-containing protein n=1 Tax=Aquiflexum gelatinilyticum TaxID=2961943 RepID=A0A9X2T2C6_9BACT|nr:CHAT domain-containing protein [Aquiflexum gelatinilyticum]